MACAQHRTQQDGQNKTSLDTRRQNRYDPVSPTGTKKVGRAGIHGEREAASNRPNFNKESRQQMARNTYPDPGGEFLFFGLMLALGIAAFAIWGC